MSILVFLCLERVGIGAGGVFYTVGVIFYALDHVRPWCHGVWHLFVLAGSASHYFATLLYL